MGPTQFFMPIAYTLPLLWYILYLFSFPFCLSDCLLLLRSIYTTIYMYWDDVDDDGDDDDSNNNNNNNNSNHAWIENELFAHNSNMIFFWWRRHSMSVICRQRISYQMYSMHACNIIIIIVVCAHATKGYDGNHNRRTSAIGCPTYSYIFVFWFEKMKLYRDNNSHDNNRVALYGVYLRVKEANPHIMPKDFTENTIFLFIYYIVKS